ncbi:MAG: hypothetical protein IJ298_00915 [Ruminococcus sp.]|nr:hypothetical protein [Ruminococcus sp.]
MNAVVRTDKMFATDNRAGLVSVRYQPSDTMTAIDNGNVVKIGALEEGSREVYKGVTPAANDAIKDIVLIASPEVMYDERKRNLDEFQNAEGAIARGYHLHTNDIFSVTKEALTGDEPAVGKVVELAAGTKLNVTASATGTVVGTIIDINVVGRYTYYVIQVA